MKIKEYIYSIEWIKELNKKRKVLEKEQKKLYKQADKTKNSFMPNLFESNYSLFDNDVKEINFALLSKQKKIKEELNKIESEIIEMGKELNTSAPIRKEEDFKLIRQSLSDLEKIDNKYKQTIKEKIEKQNNAKFKQKSKTKISIQNQSLNFNKIETNENNIINRNEIENYEYNFINDDTTKDKSLNYLNEGQVEDLNSSINSLYKLNKKGILFSNSTGTGKTLLGCGILKSIQLNNFKTKALIIVPSQNKISDWIEEAQLVNLNINKLNSITDIATKPITITTYANFRSNLEIIKQNFNVILYDESHNLQMSKLSNQNTLNHHRKIINYYKEDKLEKEAIEKNISQKNIYEKFLNDEKYRDYINKKYNNKVIFLSATPFAYIESMEYAERILFDKSIDEIRTQELGYRIRYSKVTSPEAGVEENYLQQQFHENLKSEGVLFNRELEIEKDYRRQFVLYNSCFLDLIDLISRNINIYDNESNKQKILKASLEYLNISKILESEKIKKLNERVDEHLSLGRKVIIFHQFKTKNILNPLDYLDINEFTNIKEYIKNSKKIKNKERYLDLLKKRKDFINIYDLDIKNSAYYNGDINSKERINIIKNFNSDNGNIKVLIVQSQAGREGINLHDKTGKHQRVIIDTSLPLSPTELSQKEGRIYRTATKSNAIYEYIVTHNSIEKYTFGNKINQRVGIVENLAKGRKAGDLKRILKTQYLEANFFKPNIDQGIGGKKEYLKKIKIYSQFDDAIGEYYKGLKVKSKNKSLEGVDFYQTPEPIGYSMIKYLDLVKGSSVLEPSAGNGAISRYFPDYVKKTMIEPSFILSSHLEVITEGNIIKTTFEDYDTINKFNCIVMNPPFRHAYSHIEKATKHLKNNGRLICIKPASGSLEKKLNLMEEEENLLKIAEIKMPACTFEKAGTKVMTNVNIYDKLDRETYLYQKELNHNTIKIDFTKIKDIKELFNSFNKLEIPPRMKLRFLSNSKKIDKEIINKIKKSTNTSSMIEILSNENEQKGFLVDINIIKKNYLEIQKKLNNNKNMHITY